MATNRIENIRAELAAYFNEDALIEGTEEVFYSPDKQYFFRSNYYTQTAPTHSWTVAKIEIFKAPDKKLFEFIRNDDSLFHGWLTIDDKQYLLLSEDVQGKSIYDLGRQEFHSYSFGEDEFIWCEYSPSPDCTKLAVAGCHWACPYEIRVFDTSTPVNYPYKELYRQSSFQDKLLWLNNEDLQITNRDGVVAVVKVV